MVDLVLQVCEDLDETVAYLAETQAAPHPQVTADGARDYLTHLAVRQRVSASTQNQALCAILLFCPGVLGVQVEGLANAVKAKRGARLPAVLSPPSGYGISAHALRYDRVRDLTSSLIGKRLRRPGRVRSAPIHT